MKLCLAVIIGMLTVSSVYADALLLFDGETGREFAGCLNCNRYDSASVCNRYGDYGSRYSDDSIWRRYGKYGSRYEDNSPWNRYGEGLRIVDAKGNYYGRFSKNRAHRSRIPFVIKLTELHDEMDLAELRDLFCEN